MWNVEAEVLTLLTFAVVLGGVVFGGTTLAYFLDKSRKDTPRPARTGRPNGSTTSTVDGDASQPASATVSAPAPAPAERERTPS